MGDGEPARLHLVEEALQHARLLGHLAVVAQGDRDAVGVYAVTPSPVTCTSERPASTLTLSPAANSKAVGRRECSILAPATGSRSASKVTRGSGSVSPTLSKRAIASASTAQNESPIDTNATGCRSSTCTSSDRGEFAADLGVRHHRMSPELLGDGGRIEVKEVLSKCQACPRQDVAGGEPFSTDKVNLLQLKKGALENGVDGKDCDEQSQCHRVSLVRERLGHTRAAFPDVMLATL